MLIPADGGPRDLRERIRRAATDLGLTVYAVTEMPEVAAHRLAAPRIALVHTWTNTQHEGWFRIALDKLDIPYDYISVHVIRDTPNLRNKYDVILLGPTFGDAARIIHGIPMYGDPVPWKNTDLMPNVGTSPDQTDDIRGGMGFEGLVHLRDFINRGGLFITIADNASLPIDTGLVEGVGVSNTRELQARGSVLNAVFSDRKSPIAYGYGERLAVYFNQSPVLELSWRGREESSTTRPTGRGSADDPDVPQARPYTPPPAKPKLQPGEAPPLTEDQKEALRLYLPPEALKPRVVLKFAGEKELLVSGMLAGAKELANRPAVIDVPSGKGHVVLFANNPMWRQQTQGSFFLLFNAMLNYDHLGSGRQESKPDTEER